MNKDLQPNRKLNPRAAACIGYDRGEFNLEILLKVSAVFYSVLCIFSIVTGIIYMLGKKELNPLELSDKFVNKLNEENKLSKFAKTMGLVTFVVGIVQGLTAYSIFADKWYALSIGFTLFSIASVSLKLKSKINIFPILKSLAYVAILIILTINI